jgi:predicted GNAT superfamily acetyltransferase
LIESYYGKLGTEPFYICAGKNANISDCEVVPHLSNEALEAFHTAMSFRFVDWLNHNQDVFVAYKAALGFVWA